MITIWYNQEEMKEKKPKDKYTLFQIVDRPDIILWNLMAIRHFVDLA